MRNKCEKCGGILGSKEHVCIVRCQRCGCIMGKKQHICKSVDLRGERNCESCGVVLSNIGRMRYQKLCPKCAGLKDRKYKRVLKIQLVKMFGGKCELCGYHKFIECLEFHHMEGNEKKSKCFLNKVEDNPSLFNLWCNRCHREQHIIAKTLGK